MSLLILKVFYIFVLYFQVVLSIIHVGPIWEINKSMAPTYQDWNYLGTRTSFLPHATPPTQPWSFHSPNQKNSYKNCTKLDLLPLELLHNIDMWHVGLVHRNQLKPVLIRIIQHHPVLCESAAYELKYVPFEYCTNYDHIKYVWEDRRKGPHYPVYKLVEEQIIKH